MEESWISRNAGLSVPISGITAIVQRKSQEKKKKSAAEYSIWQSITGTDNPRKNV